MAGVELPYGLPMLDGVEEVVAQSAFDTDLLTLTTTRLVVTSDYVPAGAFLGGQRFASFPLSGLARFECSSRGHKTYPWRAFGALVGLAGMAVLAFEATRTPPGNSHAYWAATHGWLGLVLLVAGAILWLVPREQNVITLTVTDGLNGRHSYSFTGESGEGQWSFAGMLAARSAPTSRP